MAKMLPQPLTRCKEICDGLSTKYAAIVAIGISTGCRISEILALTRADLIENGAFKEEIEFVKLKTRRKSTRRMSIPEEWRPYIVQHLNEDANRGYSLKTDFVFRGQHGKPLSRITVYLEFRKRFGKRFGTHWMRKTFANTMYQFYFPQFPGNSFKSADMVRQLLGQASLDAVARYLSIDEPKPADVAEVFSMSRINAKTEEGKR